MALALLSRMEANQAPLWISSQILREYLAVTTRSQGRSPGLPMSEALEHTRFFSQRFWVAEDGPEIRSQLFTLLVTYPTAGKQVLDANIVATMLANGVTHLLTKNVADFRRFGSLITIEAP